MGIIPQNADLTKRPKEIPSWASQTADQKKIEARQMETYAGFGEHTDEQVGRLVDALQGMGVMDNTLFIYIVGDNGASAEGGPEGTYNEMMALNGIISTAAINMPHLEAWGDPTTFPHYAIGWAWAGDTPFQWTKQIASHYGGTTNGIVMQWPTRIRDKGGIRQQFTHVTDIAPTVLEAANLPFPTSVNGTTQTPFNGTSMAYSFDDPKAGETHTTQYFEMFGNRGIYSNGWVAAARHSIPWLMTQNPPLTADVWELYHTAEDFSQAHDLAAQNPAKLKELQDLFMKQAVANHVLPIDDRRSERFDPKMAGRPDLMNGRTSLTVYPLYSIRMPREVPFIESLSLDIRFSGFFGVVRLALGRVIGGRGGFCVMRKENLRWRAAATTVASQMPRVPFRVLVVSGVAADRHRPVNGIQHGAVTLVGGTGSPPQYRERCR